MNRFGSVIGLIALFLLKASLVWTIWLMVVGALALIGAAPFRRARVRSAMP